MPRLLTSLHPARRTAAFAVLALAAAGTTACSDGASPAALPEAALPELAAATLGQLADSSRLAGDLLGAAVFAEAQAAVGSAPSAGTVRITENGTAQDWSAVAYRTVLPAMCQAIAAAQLPPGCRLNRPSVVAWSRVAPARTLMLWAPEGNSTFTGTLPWTLTGTSLSGQYHDRWVTMSAVPLPVPAGARPQPAGPLDIPLLWGLSSGSASVSTTAGTTPCSAREGGALLPGMFGRCVLGSAVVRWDVTVRPMPFGTDGLSGWPAPRTLVAASATLPAVVWQVDSVRAVVPPLVPPGGAPGAPPVVPPPGAEPVGPRLPLPVASRLEVLAATRDSVRVRFTVRAFEAATLGFATAQRFEVEALGGGAVAWRWSAGQMFAQAAGTEVLTAGAERRYEATWRAPQRGAWVLRARTVNTSGPATESVAPVVVP